jgi:hypothetical protein
VPAGPDNPETGQPNGKPDGVHVATGRRWPGPEHGAVDLDALAAIDAARSTGDPGALYDELATQG